MGIEKSRRKSLKICCAAMAFILLLITVVIIALSFTIFKPKNPEISAYPTGLENIGLSNLTTNVTLGMIITIDNRNYGSFKFQNSTAYVDYHGMIVAEIPIGEDLVPARSKINITTSADFMTDKLITSSYLLQDIETGSLNFTSTSIMHGKVGMLKVLKTGANVSGILFLAMIGARIVKFER
ncbi:uncharacterized protein [Rutidosis leptorrhynchoides]|uniref:uncharacterized protein n=1 Tax=Rutidosis leptorrhynchoides TaxID=125765 RepID=UPI003A992921